MSHSHDHDHNHNHDHNHDHDHKDNHAHAHTHAPEQDPYFVDQLCMTVMGATFGGICLILYFWNRDMLKLMLDAQFNIYILMSGIALTLFALVRAGVLWVEVGKTSTHAHQHHDHDHSSESAKQSEATDCCPCPAPSASHSHSHDGHDHSWAPWRYVVLLVPIVLFLMGLPNSLSVGAMEVKVMAEENQKESLQVAQCLAYGPSWGQEGLLFVCYGPAEKAGTGKEAPEFTFQTLEGMAADKSFRDNNRGRRVWVRGQFSPDPRSSRVFSLVRCRIQCCAQDMVKLNVPIICKESITHVQPSEWIKVTGAIDFVEVERGYRTVLRVSHRKDVEKTGRETDWYLTSN